jgi:hypothetical protein
MHLDAGWRDLDRPTHRVHVSNVYIDAPNPRSNVMWDMQVISGIRSLGDHGGARRVNAPTFPTRARYLCFRHVHGV